MGVAIQTYSCDQIQPSRDRRLATKKPIKLKVSSTYVKGDVLAEITGVNEIQTMTFGGTGGTSTFTVSFGGITSAAIAWSATNATLIANVQAALDAMSSVGTGNTLVADSTLSSGIGNITITYQNQLGSTNVALMTTAIVTGALTTSIANTTAGVTGSNGTFDIFASGASDGTQLARCILPFSCTTDASGNITLGTGSSGGDFGTTWPSVWAWFGGTFFTSDLPNLTSTMVTALGGKMISGAIAKRGEFRF